jgi:hypothetical protein
MFTQAVPQKKVLWLGCGLACSYLVIPTGMAGFLFGVAFWRAGHEAEVSWHD